MGQYWMAVNIAKKEKLEDKDHCHKQMEHSWKYNPFMLKVCALLWSDWAGDEVRWVGDYTDLEDNGESLYDIADKYTEPEVPHSIRDTLNRLDADEDGYCEAVEAWYKDKILVNQNTGQWLHLGRYFRKERENPERKPEERNWVEHPVSLMLAAPGDGGGGDYPFPEFGYGLFSGGKIAIVEEGQAPELKKEDNLTYIVSFYENRGHVLGATPKPTDIVIKSTAAIDW